MWYIQVIIIHRFGKILLASKNNKLIGLWIEGQKYHLANLKEEIQEKDDEAILNSEALLPDVVEKNIFNGKIKLKNVPTNSNWYGVTYKEDLEGVKKAISDLIKEGVYPNKLWKM